MTTDLPLVDLVITPGDIVEVEEMLKTVPIDPGSRSHIHLLGETNAYRVTVFRALAAGLASLALTLAFAMLITYTTTGTQRDRRRRRLDLCVSELLLILRISMNDAMDGFAFNRALETKGEERKNRRIRSRA